MSTHADASGASAPDPRALRRAFGAFATGVTIATTLAPDGTPCGFTANAFSSVSLDPPLLLICQAKSSSSFAAFRDAGRFAVNVLAEPQAELSTLFATRGADKFAAAAWSARATGAPVLDGVAAWFDCLTEDVIDAGDHVVLIGRIAAFGDRDVAPLGYWRGAYVRFGEEAGRGVAGELRVAAIVERRREALLRVAPDGTAALPSATAFGPVEAADSLLGLLASAGLRASLPFVFASFDEGETHTIVYRGSAPEAADPPEGWMFARFDAIPLSRMRPGEAEALRLYVDSRDAAGQHGRYLGAPA